MAQQVLTFKVKICPTGCGESHSYKVEVRTVPTFGSRRDSAPTTQVNQPVYKADLLVACPTKGEEYQVTVEIPYTRGEKVINVKAGLDV
jgi:hypothetical protein